MFDEETPRQKTTMHVVGQDLSPLSLEEIDARIAQLQDEIERLKQARAKKEAVKGAADALFGKKV